MLRALAFVACAVAVTAAAQGITAQPHKESVATELAAPVRAVLADGGVRATADGVTLDFWWVKALPVPSTPPSWNAVEEGTLVGAVKVGADFHDIRGHLIRAGVYTLRYGVQPDNGDHLGTSPFREYLLVSPADVDADPAPRGHKGTIELSKRTIGGSHPAVWSIDPPVATKSPLREHITELNHHAVIVEVPIARDGKPAGALRFGIVLIGKIEA